jgi:putative two-component system response regulator
MTLKPTILVVDDMPDNIRIIHGVLADKFTVRAATSGQKALELAQMEPLPDLILLDVMMPIMSGFEVCQQLKLDPNTSRIPIIFVTAKTEEWDEQTGLELGAVDYICKPISPAVLTVRVKNQLALANQARQLEDLVKLRTKELENTRHKIILKLGRAAEFRDNETGLHIVRIGHLSQMLAQHIGATDTWCEHILHASPMHDIGKIGIPDAILLKPGRLTDDERTIMQQHPILGAEILEDDDNAPLLVMAKEIALYHHEHWNGNGYPTGISGKDIPLSARIVAIVDVFDALTSTRPYKKPWPTQTALDYIADGAGKQFDPDLVTAFLACRDKVEQIKLQFWEPESPEQPMS